MISLNRSTLYTLFIICLLSGCNQNNLTLNGQWKVIAGSHFEESKEAWLEISDESFTMIGPVPGAETQCLEKLTLEIQEDENGNYILINPEYRSEQFLLTIIEPKESGHGWIFQINNRKTEMEVTAVRSRNVESDMYLCD